MEMILTFVTVLAGLYAAGYLLISIGIFILYMRLSSRQQSAASISVNGWGMAGFVVSVSWLITRLFS